ncbi:MAG: BlaI/MecI/CopY family transcriptional regulator [Bacteroidetes bacterium]|nr:BlaI/MecI/CopY family transcriptional regulator [Bacteroidota bacterium]
MNKEKKNNQPTDSELEILGVLWDNGPSTVRFVNEYLSKRRDIGYTTTLKIMQIMHEKGMLQREADGRMHVYTPMLSEKETQGKLIDRLLETAFGGSASRLVMQALGNHESSPEELEQIKKLIKKLEEGKQ